MNWKEQIGAKINEKQDIIKKLAITIGENPELGFSEKIAADLLCNALSDAGFEVEQGVAGMETSFKATIGKGEPNVAFLCEYDALPELGHACGHNLIAAASVGAALGLAPYIEELAGKVTVLGTPAEETGSGKVILVEAGFFEDINAAMMFHPAAQNLLMAISNALDAYEFEFIGRSAHAADSPEEGINALDGVLALFNGINAWREHLPDGVRIHGIISEGGKAPNIVPARAIARFYFRAPQRKLLNYITARVLKIAEGAALMTGTKVSWHQFELGTDNMMPSHPLALAFGANLQKLGLDNIEEFSEGRGSSDIGNVSRVVPAIHPYLSIGSGLIAHTPEFTKASLSEKGLQTAIIAAQALAFTAIDLYTDPLLLETIQKEHALLKGSS